jgi:hypothetical protein
MDRWLWELPIFSSKGLMPTCMIMMTIRVELSIVENPWSFQHRYILTNSTESLERSGIDRGNAWQRREFIYLGCAC